jgi:hypothetical protein
LLNDADDETYLEKNMELNQLAHDVIFRFFAECFNAAEGNQIPLCSYLRRSGMDDVLDLKNKSWISIDDLYE